MIRLTTIFIATLSLSGCSFLVEVILFNNSDSSIEICNLNHTNQRCQIIEPKSSNKVLLVADKKANAWSYGITKLNETKVYSFAFEPYPAQASNIYCQGFFMKKCDIPLQYEPNGFLYWAGKNQELPTIIFPNQPPGFPVAPDA
jgi:hypothetical protein